MPKAILFILTSHSDLGATGSKTGTWLEELAAAYYVFVDAGHTVTLSSTAGGAAPLDPASLEEPWLTSAGTRFRGDEAAMAALAATVAITDVDAGGFDAAYCVGGAGAAWDFPTHPALKSVIESIDRADGVISGVCHGVLGLTTALQIDGSPLVAGRRVTAISNKEEVWIGVEKGPR